MYQQRREGDKPKVIRSANESNSFPIGEYALKSRAENPSRKSNKAPATTHTRTINELP